MGKDFIPGGIDISSSQLNTLYKLLTMSTSRLDLIVKGAQVISGSPIFFITDTKLAIPHVTEESK